MRKQLAALAAIAMLSSGSAAFAHEGHTHRIMGTIKAVDASHLVVATSDAKTHKEKDVDVVIDAKTTFRRGSNATTRDQLKSGERVVVNVGSGKEPLKAVEIRVAG
jgi:hypothetical protein